jgi:trans-aconitate methyltransferase
MIGIRKGFEQVADAHIDKDYVFDLVRGIARFTGSGLVAALARTIAEHPDAPLDNAFNHKQVASKQWARDMLASHTDASFDTIWLMGGWLGILPAMLFDDERFSIGRIISFDVDPSVGAIAETLNRTLAGEDRFSARTADMYELNYTAPDQPDMVINTSCEHIADLPHWLGLLPSGCQVMLQSNDYFSEPTHINCVNSVDDFAQQAGLSQLTYAGSLKLPKYTRFMLIGRV